MVCPSLCSAEKMPHSSGNSLGTRSVREGSPAGTAIRKEPDAPQQSPFPVTGVTVRPVQVTGRTQRTNFLQQPAGCQGLPVAGDVTTPPERQGAHRGHQQGGRRRPGPAEPTRTTHPMSGQGGSNGWISPSGVCISFGVLRQSLALNLKH